MPNIVELQTIVDVVAGVLDVAGTYGSAVLPFKLLVGYDKFSFYPRPGRTRVVRFNGRSRRSPWLVDAQSMSRR